MLVFARSIAAKYAVGFLLVIGLGVSTWKAQPHVQRPYLYDHLYLPSGKFVTQASLGYRQLVADVIWFSAVQYYGGYRRDQNDLAYFEGLIDIVTDLDPNFEFPYIFGAVVLSQDLTNLDNAINLLKKGMF